MHQTTQQGQSRVRPKTSQESKLQGSQEIGSTGPGGPQQGPTRGPKHDLHLLQPEPRRLEASSSVLLAAGTEAKESQPHREKVLERNKRREPGKAQSVAYTSPNRPADAHPRATCRVKSHFQKFSHTPTLFSFRQSLWKILWSIRAETMTSSLLVWVQEVISK